MWGEKNRCLPVKPQWGSPEFVFGLNISTLIGFTIDSEIISKLIACVNNICMILIDLDMHAIPAHDVRPIVVSILLPSHIFSACVRCFPHAVILQAPINMIGTLLIGIYCIKLSDRRLIIFDPVLSAVIADIDPTIVAVDEVFGVTGVNPQGMVIDVYIWCINARKLLAAIS